MDKFHVKCHFENSDKTVEFFGFSFEELQKVLQAKTKQTRFVNKDSRGTFVIVDMAKVTHIEAVPSY